PQRLEPADQLVEREDRAALLRAAELGHRLRQQLLQRRQLLQLRRRLRARGKRDQPQRGESREQLAHSKRTSFWVLSSSSSSAMPPSPSSASRVTSRSFASGNGPLNSHCVPKRYTCFFFSSDTSTSPPGRTRAALRWSSASSSPGLLPGTPNDLSSRPKRAASRAATITSPFGVSARLFGSSAATLAPIFASLSKG